MKNITKSLYVFSLVSLVIVSLSCNTVENETPSGEVVDISHFTVDNFPRVDGSTSNIPMMRVIACEIFDLSYVWFESTDGTMQPFPEDNQQKSSEVNFARNIEFTKTIRAYNRLIYDSADVILVASEPSDEHVQLATSLGVSFSVAPIALDGLVFMVNTENPVDNLTDEQVIDIFTGNITHWNEVGGNQAAINAYTRNTNSGSQELMEKIVMKGRPVIPGQVIMSMMGLLQQLEMDTSGIGYTVYYYSATMVPKPGIKRLSIEGVEVNPATINSGTYKYIAPVYAIIRANLDKSSNAYLFWKWLQTATGQTAVAKSGYVPYTNH